MYPILLHLIVFLNIMQFDCSSLVHLHYMHDSVGDVLQGGEAQRVLLAVLLALKPQFVLLDEVTSALDHKSALKTEKVLKDSGAALIWVTHDNQQPARVGGRILHLPLGTEMAVDQLIASPRVTDDELKLAIEIDKPTNGNGQH